MRGHVDAETIAAFREGMLSRRSAARVAAHLPACPDCARADARLSDVSVLLAATPVPPVPSSLVARLETALAEEVARSRALPTTDDSAEQDTATDVTAAPAAPVTSLAGAPGDTRLSPVARPGAAAGRGRARSRRVPGRVARRAAIVAAALVVAGGGAYGLSQALPAGSGVESSASGAAGVHSASAGLAPKPLAGQANSPERGGYRIVASGTDYRPGRLRAQVEAVLGRYGTAGALSGNSAAKTIVPASTRTRLDACIARASGGRTPELVDAARYAGRPATVIVIPAGTGRTVVVVGPDCSGSRSDVITRLSLPGSG